MKIGASIMVYNMAPFIKAVISSLSWTDGIYLYDDNSDDGTAEIASTYSKAPIIIERSLDARLAFDRSELKVRNYILNKAFEKLKCDILIFIDGDELLSEKIKPKIEQMWHNKKHDSMSFGIWHLYDNKRYLHFWETHINGVYMIDPHTRIITKNRKFERLFKNKEVPIIHATKKTMCLHGPYHFHLKYFHQSPYPNYSIDFLPKHLNYRSVKPYLRKLPFELPCDIKLALNLVEWKKLNFIERPYQNVYPQKKVKYTNPNMALVHPKDKE